MSAGISDIVVFPPPLARGMKLWPRPAGFGVPERVAVLGGRRGPPVPDALDGKIDEQTAEIDRRRRRASGAVTRGAAGVRVIYDQ
jgi:hypothetical protein